MIKIVYALLIGSILTGCNNITNPTPDIVKPQEISFDGNTQNSGILYQITSGGFIITESARARYNALIKKYGDKCTPALTEDFGITPVYIITDEGFENFAKLVLWQKNPDVLDDITMNAKPKWWQFWKKTK